MPTYLLCPERAAPALLQFPACPAAPMLLNFRPAPSEPRCREPSCSSGGSYKASSLGLAGPGRQKERRPVCTPHVQTLSALLFDYALTDNRKSAAKKLQLCLHYTIYWYIITNVSQNPIKILFVVVCSQK